jgi:NitT/TauT family transport system substrate-binding protein
VLGVLVAFAGLAGCVSQPPASPPGFLTEVRVAISPLASTIPAHVAEIRGIFERNGLRVRSTEGNDLPSFAAALDQGQYDIVLSVPTIVLVAADRGLDVQIISRLQRSSAARPGTVWISRDPTIESIAQLRNARIAVPALTGQVTDSLVYLLQRAGVPRDQVTFVQVPFAAMTDQLKAGRVDAAVAGSPFNTGMAAQGFRLHEDVVVAAVREASGGGVDNAMTSLFVSTSAFTRAHPDAIRAWRRSLGEAVEQLRSDEGEVRAQMQSWLKMPPEVARTAHLPAWQPEVAPADLVPYVTISKAVGSIRGEPDVARLVWQDHP